MAMIPMEQMIADEKEYTNTSASFDGKVHAVRRNGIVFIYMPSVKSGSTGNTYLDACTLDAIYRPSRNTNIRVWDTSNSVWVYYAVNTNGVCQAFIHKSGTIANSTNTTNTCLVCPC